MTAPRPLASSSDHRDGEPGTGRDGDPSVVEVELTGLPVELHRAVRHHYSSLVREVALISAAPPGPGGRTPAPLPSLAGAIARHEDALEPLLRPPPEAPGSGSDFFDITLHLSDQHADPLGGLAHLLEEADQLGAEGLLLTPPSPPAVRAFRDWLVHELDAQARGAAPTSWSVWAEGPGADRVGSAAAGPLSPLTGDRDELFRLMAVRAPALMWVAGLDGEERVVNRGWRQLTGVDLDQPGHSWLQVVHPDDVARCTGAFREAVRRHGPVETEYRVRRYDGAYRWLMDRGVPWHDARGAVVGYVGSCIDITDRKRIEEELHLAAEQARLAFEVGRLGYWRWSPRAGELRLGAALEALLGRPAGDYPHTVDAYLALVHPDDVDKVAAVAREAWASGEELRLEHRVVRPDGDVLWIEARGAPVPDDTGKAVEWVGVGIDTTAAKRQALERAELLRQSVKARKEAERANAALRQMVGQLDSLVRQERHVAQTVQRALFTDELVHAEGIEVAGRYLPGATDLTVGGDWYDVLGTSAGPLLVIGDVAGHGLHAAAVMARIRHALQFAAGEHASPADLVSRLNHFFASSPGDDLATVCALLVDRRSGHLCYTNAGHPPPVLLPREGPPRFLAGGLGPPLGAVDRLVYPDAACPVAPGDRLVLYTDGLVERRGEPLDQSLDRLLGAARRAPGPVDPLVDFLLDQLLDAEPTDDVAVLAALVGDLG